jgi:hypothetical protein
MGWSLVFFGKKLQNKKMEHPVTKSPFSQENFTNFSSKKQYLEKVFVTLEISVVKSGKDSTSTPHEFGHTQGGRDEKKTPAKV